MLKAAQFRAVYRRGLRAASGPLRARMIANGREHGRLGLSVGLKAAGGAVARNRIRRLVRDSFRLRQHHLAGLDVVVGLPHASGASKRSVRRALPKLWSAVARSPASGGAAAKGRR